MANRWVQLRSLPSPSSEGSGVRMALPSLSLQRQEDWLLCPSVLQSLPLSTNNPQCRPGSSHRPGNSQKKRLQQLGITTPTQQLGCAAPGQKLSLWVHHTQGLRLPGTSHAGGWEPKTWASSLPMELFMKKDSVVNDVPTPQSYVHLEPQNVTIFGNRDFTDVIS